MHRRNVKTVMKACADIHSCKDYLHTYKLDSASLHVSAWFSLDPDSSHCPMTCCQVWGLSLIVDSKLQIGVNVCLCDRLVT